MSLDDAFQTPQSKRRYVRQLFATIADRYDLITRVLSYGQDARWKATLVSMAEVRGGERALDLACGTGDLAFAVAARGARAVGLDITHRMLQLAQAKSTAARPITGDMTSLPFRSGAFDLVTTGYGLRNVATRSRVLRPGGRLLSRFNRPNRRFGRSAYLPGWAPLAALHHPVPTGTFRFERAAIRARAALRRMACAVYQGRIMPLLFGLMTLVTQRA